MTNQDRSTSIPPNSNRLHSWRQNVLFEIYDPFKANVQVISFVYLAQPQLYIFFTCCSDYPNRIRRWPCQRLFMVVYLNSYIMYFWFFANGKKKIVEILWRGTIWRVKVITNRTRIVISYKELFKSHQWLRSVRIVDISMLVYPNNHFFQSVGVISKWINPIFIWIDFGRYDFILYKNFPSNAIDEIGHIPSPSEQGMSSPTYISMAWFYCIAKF